MKPRLIVAAIVFWPWIIIAMQLLVIWWATSRGCVVSARGPEPCIVMGMDIGEEAINHYKLCLEESKTVLWNGPMGVFEFSNFAEGTKQIAYGIVSGTERGAYSLVGGGDSVAAVNQLNLAEHVSYVSTGGGAMLEYLEGKVLPGVAALLN